MNPQTFLLIFSAAGIALFVFAIVLLALSKEGRIVTIAKLTKTPLLIKIDPEGKSVSLERIPDKELVERKGEVYYLGGWPSYRWGGVKAFFVVANDVTDYDPVVVAEIQKAVTEGYDTFDHLKEVIWEDVEEEVPVKKEDGTIEYQKVRYRKFKVLPARVTKVLNFKPLKSRKGFSFLVEELVPIDFGTIAMFYNRKLSTNTVLKILKQRDLEWLEEFNKTYTKWLKKMKIDIKKGSGLGFNPVWLIYLGIFVFIVLMGLSMYGGKLGLGGGVRPLPPSP